MRQPTHRLEIVLRSLGLAALALLLVTAAGAPAAPAPETAPESFIVQGRDLAQAARSVREVGGETTDELGIIDAVAARLTPEQVAALREDPTLRVLENRATEVTGKKTSTDGGGGGKGGGGGTDYPEIPDTVVPRLVGAPAVWAQNVTGAGVGVAVVDTAAKWTLPGIKEDRAGLQRVLAIHDAIENRTWDFVAGVSRKKADEIPADLYGHGTHVTGVIANSAVTAAGDHGGVAPDADLVLVRALGDDGSGSYATVIKAIDFVVKNKDLFGIRVLNLSLSAPPQSFYWEDPLNQAVMEAWRQGIVVVASAGNTGPDPMSIGVPGNVPYVVTVGAMSDAVTPETGTDDFLASFSSAGPTVEGFVKPELVAPGGHVISNMQSSTHLATVHSEYQFGDQYFQMSGTSQATGVVSGVVALMLEHDPTLSPDDVKCRLMTASRPAVAADGTLAYSVFQQGAGLVDAYDAVFGTASGCANRGLDLALDLLREGESLVAPVHYRGRANRLPDGSYYLEGLDGDGFMWSDGYLWNDGFMWSDGYLWNDGFMWSDGYLWNDGFMWSDGYLWSDVKFKADLTEAMSANVWVDQE